MTITKPMGVFSTCIFICALFASNEALKRKIHTTFWPNCEEYKGNCTLSKELGNNVVYVKAASEKHDDLHYVFSTISVPTVILARTTGADAELEFNWDLLNSQSIDGAIKVKKDPAAKVDYLYSVSFTRLIEYNDTEDSADLNDKHLTADDFKIRDFSDFFWQSLPDSSKDTNEFVFNSTSDFFKPSDSNNGSLSFSFKVPDTAGRVSEQPALKYTVNETLFDFVLANYTPSFSHSRFALEAVLVSLSDNKEMTVETSRSIDDEYSPGVFQITNWLPNPKDRKISGFLQWKPVCYNAASRGTQTVTKVKDYKTVDVSERNQTVKQIDLSVVTALFGNVWNRKGVIARGSNISFGLTKDKFYLANNYTAWSAAIGYGTPPEDTISTMVIGVISAGLGIPVVLIILGGLYTCVKRAKNTSGEYQVINQSTPQ